MASGVNLLNDNSQRIDSSEFIGAATFVILFFSRRAFLPMPHRRSEYDRGIEITWSELPILVILTDPIRDHPESSGIGCATG